jgi:aldehyde dehydrogenase (NAD+)
MARALRVAGKIEAGTVSINAAFYPDISVPFGGYKQSGQGRESGRAGLDGYLQAKTIRINISTPSK